MLQCCFFGAAKFDAFFICCIDEFDEGSRTSPAVLSDAIEYGADGVEKLAIPCLLQSRPISLDGVVFAVIGR